MHRVKHVKQWVKSSASKIWQQTRPLMTKAASRLNKAMPGQLHDLIPLLGTLMGTVAFGLWRQNIAATLFAGIGLFFLAGIYQATEKMLAAIRRSDRDLRYSDGHTLADPTPATSNALNEAIGGLKPWLASEVSLTEENAKEYCAVLMDSVTAPLVVSPADGKRSRQR